MEAAFKRNIKSGKEFDSLFPAPLNQFVELPKGDVFATLESIQTIVSTTLNQTTKIAQKLKNDSLGKTCANIWKFLYSHIQYTPDEPGVEQLRNPSRSWHDRTAGIDCDCYSIFISSILTNLGIDHSLRITEYGYKGYFQHVYIIVPKVKKPKNRKDYYVIDPVLDKFDLEKEFTKKHDRIMKIPQQYLNGPGVVVKTFGTEFDSLGMGGLGSVKNVENQFLDSLANNLSNSLLMVKTNPASVSSIVDPEVYEKQLEYLLENWNDPVARMAVLDELEEMEFLAEGNATVGVNGLGCLCPDTSYSKPAVISTREASQKVDLLRQRRRASKRVAPATVKNGGLMLHPVTKSIYDKMNPKDLISTLNGVNGLGGLFAKIKEGVKNVANKVTTAVKNTASKVGTAVKNTAAKVGEAAKKVGTAIVQQNPASIAIRNGVYLAMKTNVLQLGEKFYYSYLSPSQASEMGFDINEWNKLVSQREKLESTIEKLGGKADNLRSAIVTGRAKTKVEFPVLGIAAAAVGTAAASGVIAQIVQWLKNIDFTKLVSKLKGIGTKIGFQPKQDNDEADNSFPNFNKPNLNFSNMFKPTTLVTKSGESVDVVVDNTTAFTKPTATGSGSSSDNKPEEEKSNMPLILGGIAVLGIGLAVAKKQSAKATKTTKKVKV
jgi:hypothetical protein